MCDLLLTAHEATCIYVTDSDATLLLLLQVFGKCPLFGVEYETEVPVKI